MDIPDYRSHDLKIGYLTRPISENPDNSRNQTSDLSNTENLWKAQSSLETQNRLGKIDSED